MADHREYYRRNLPHWQPEGATLFITTRLAGSLPRKVIDDLMVERKDEIEALTQITPQDEYKRVLYRGERIAFGRWDSILARCEFGPQWLREPKIANSVADALHYRDGKSFDLLAYCVMPNHLHVVFTPLQRNDETCYPLNRILQSFKRYTARKANEILDRKGKFWQAESYDHVVRNQEELSRIIQYVIENPVKAGLANNWKDWPWTYCKSG